MIYLLSLRRFFIKENSPISKSKYKNIKLFQYKDALDILITQHLTIKKPYVHTQTTS